MIDVVVLEGKCLRKTPFDNANGDEDAAILVGGSPEYLRVSDTENVWGVYLVRDEKGKDSGKPLTALVRHRGKSVEVYGPAFFVGLGRTGFRELLHSEEEWLHLTGVVQIR
jgi:hypothetical protein